MKRVNIIGVPTSITKTNDAIDYITNNLEKAKESYICVSNVHTTVMAKEDSSFNKILADSFLTLPDGKPLSIVAKLKGCKDIGQVRGVDLMETLFSDNDLYKHYFYGNTKENLELLIKNLKVNYPKLKIAGYRESVFRELSDDEFNNLVTEIKGTGADFLWIGLGAPKQECFAYKIKGKTGALAIGVGGAFNVLAGVVPDAPKIFRMLSLEWLFRLIMEPKRLFKRYFTTNLKFIYYVLSNKT